MAGCAGRAASCIRRARTHERAAAEPQQLEAADARDGLDDPAAAVALVAYAFAALALLWALRIGAGAYWRLNLVSQLTVLFAFHAAALYLAGRLPPGGVTARALLAAFVGAVAEIASSAWSVRRTQTERIYRLTQLSRLVGVAAAVAVAFAIVRMFS